MIYTVELSQSVVEKIEEIRQKLVGRGLNVKAKDLASLIEFELFFLDEVAEFCRRKLTFSAETRSRLEALMERNGFKTHEEAISFLLDFYETATRRKLLLEELEVTSDV